MWIVLTIKQRSIGGNVEIKSIWNGLAWFGLITLIILAILAWSRLKGIRRNNDQFREAAFEHEGDAYANCGVEGPWVNSQKGQLTER